MKNTIKYIFLLSSLFLNQAVSGEPIVELEKKSEAVKQDIIKARTANALWRDTQKMYELSQQLLQEGNYKQADQLLDDTLHQIHTAQQQANKQRNKITVPIYLRH